MGHRGDSAQLHPVVTISLSELQGVFYENVRSFGGRVKKFFSRGIRTWGDKVSVKIN